jgi:hypothetical protein
MAGSIWEWGFKVPILARVKDVATVSGHVLHTSFANSWLHAPVCLRRLPWDWGLTLIMRFSFLGIDQFSRQSLFKRRLELALLISCQALARTTATVE